MFNMAEAKSTNIRYCKLTRDGAATVKLKFKRKRPKDNTNEIIRVQSLTAE